MINEIINHALKNNELKITSKEKRKHFEVLLFLLIFPVIIIFVTFLTPEKTTQSIVNGSIILIASFLVIFGVYKLQQKRLQFRTVATNLHRKQVLKIIKKVGKELEWKIEIIDGNYILARTHPSYFSGSWGEQITIIIDDNQVLVNSICDLQKQTSLVSMGRNGKNMDTLIDMINRTKRLPKK